MKKIILINLVILFAAIQILPAYAVAENDEIKTVTLKEGDLIELTVQEHPEMNQQQIIDETGNIYFSYIDHIKASGKTLEELKKDVSEQYKKNDLFFAFDLQVVKLNRKIYLLGNFNHPGEYQLNSDKVFLTEAISMAGGPSSSAELGNVTISHDNNGKKEQVQVNLKNILNGSDKDIEIHPGDSIYIDTRLFVSMQEYLPYLSIILTLAILLKK